jgi:hypothetical protein
MISKENLSDSHFAWFRELSSTIGRFLAYRSHSAHLRAHEKIPSTPLAQGSGSRESAAKSSPYAWPSAGANGGVSSRP